MPENGEGLPKEEGTIKPWGDPDLRERDIDPHEAQRQRIGSKPKLEKTKNPLKGRFGVLDYINHKQD